jgi:diguanylate cyclase (GGDEF)-like protein
MGNPISKPSAPAAIEKELAELQDQYILNLPKKIARLNDLWQKLVHYSWSDAAFGLLQRITHGLAGSGKTFGFEQLSHDARKLDNYLLPFVDRKQRPSAEERATIEALIKSLEATAVNCEARQQTLKLGSIDRYRPSGAQKTVYIVDDDTHLAHYLSTILSNIGYHVRTFSTPRLALEFTTHQPPDLVIMDIMFPEGNLAGIEIIDDLRASAGKRIPVVFVSSRTDLNARVNAVRSGGDAYLTKPIDVPRLLEKLNDLIAVYENEKYRVMIVDDDEELSSYYALILRKAGMDVTVINKPVKVLETLDNFNPDILLMDMYMPDYNGLELASVIRQEDKYIALPIVFVSAEGSKDVHEQAFRLGVDDFIVKPIIGDKLVETIRRQVKRARKLNLKISKLSKFDSKTLLANRQYFLEQLEFALTTLSDGDAKPALIDISIRNVDNIIDRAGLEWVESLNQQIANIIVSNIDRQDLATQFSEKVYMVLTHAQDMDQTILLVQLLRHAITNSNLHLDGHNFSANVNIGVIPLSDDVASLHSLLVHAVELSDQANERGENKFIISEKTWGTSGVPGPEINEELVSQALENNNFKLAYQPIINLENNNDEKYEVLLRLHDDKGKVLLPHQFFPVVKKKNLITKLDRWVIEHAISALANNSHTRGGTDIFIKVSFESQQDSMLLARISNSITASGLPGEKRIVFEINEKDLMIDQVSVAEFCKRVHKLNCGISVTNYGQSLQDFRVFDLLPVDYVKLHGSCLQDILVDQDKQNAIRQLIDEALRHKVQVIAGTIEDPATLSLLWDLGARFFQGYFIHEPEFSLDYDFALSVMH